MRRSAVTSLAYDPANSAVLSGSADGSLALWSVEGRCLERFDKISNKQVRAGGGAMEGAMRGAAWLALGCGPLLHAANTGQANSQRRLLPPTSAPHPPLLPDAYPP